MLTIRAMQPADLPTLYEIAHSAFTPDFEQYGHYPPLLNTRARRLSPSHKNGRVFLLNGEIIGGAYLWEASPGHVTLGAIFLGPAYQNKGHGTQLMRLLEAQYPAAHTWSLETPYKAFRNHHFYEKLGYTKTGQEQPTPGEAFTVFLYEKRVGMRNLL